MKKLLTVASVFAMLAIFAVPASAEPAPCDPPTPGQTETCTVHLNNVTASMPVQPIPCPDGSTVPGGLLTVTIENGVAHITVNGAGDEWDTMTAEGPFTFVADTGTVYTGHFATWFGDSNNNQNQVHHGVINFVGTSADGSHLNLHEEFHVSISASGNLNFFVKPHC